VSRGQSCLTLKLHLLAPFDEAPGVLPVSTACGAAAGGYHQAVVASGGMTTTAIKRTLSMRPEVDRMLADHVERTPGATMSSTVNAALVDYLEAAALTAYQQWELEADPDERSALAAFDAHNEESWASG
jgi:hypothetical protein